VPTSRAAEQVAQIGDLLQDESIGGGFLTRHNCVQMRLPGQIEQIKDQQKSSESRASLNIYSSEFVMQ
jgi:hypothetical protein